MTKDIDILKKTLVNEIDSLVDDIQVNSVLNNKSFINKIFSEKIVPNLFEIKTNLEVGNFHLIDLREKINNCVAITSDIVDLDKNYYIFYSRIKILRENILSKIF
ncbi:MAG: hypothetical protein GWO78_03045 [Dehalococcoidales bacterium]|jgi:hypothetical protein|nr:hypothetical protein [Dehalococcoidia bacterium]NCG34959.1 hypothetical protein [Dehalococcoidales bacterium]